VAVSNASLRERIVSIMRKYSYNRLQSYYFFLNFATFLVN
jgi:hypothetical protein